MSELTAEYQINGLTYKSNNENIITRDAAGNIQIDNKYSDLLIIEPVKPVITLESALRVIDTQFNYYTFPISSEIDTTDLLDIDLNQENFVDTISTRYTIPYQEYPPGRPNDYHRLSTTQESAWFTGDANLQISGFVELPFTGPNQVTPYTFTLTPDMIDIMKNSNKTIKFFIQMQATPDPDPDDPSKDVSVELKLIRRNAELYRNPDLARLKTSSAGDYNAGDYPILSLEYILDLNEIYHYDTFSVQAVAGSDCWYLGNNTIWNIDLIDIPVDGKTGVVSTSSKTSLYINGVTIIDGRD
jgi:hypothetical protein